MPVTLVCESCGDEFEVPPCREDSAKYCSQDCFGDTVTKDESNYTTYVCDHCGDEFEALKSRDRSFCSNECNTKNQKDRVELECEICDSSFEVVKAQEDYRTTCSHECMGVKQSQNRVGENHPNYKGQVEVVCENCGDAFEVTPARKDKAKYCSRDCLSEAYQGVNIANNQKKRVTLTCDGCGGEFKRQAWHADRNQDRHFCSQECEAKNRPTGEDAHHWKGGYRYHYGEKWNRIRSEVVERDGLECWLCGLPSGAHQELFNQDINVHHINPYRESKDNSKGNLLALCKYCHMRLE